MSMNNKVLPVVIRFGIPEIYKSITSCIEKNGRIRPFFVVYKIFYSAYCAG